MLSPIFCYWGKKNSGESNIIQFHLTLKCTIDHSSHFCDCVLVSKRIFQHHDRGLTKFHAGSEQLLVCVVINNSSYLTVKNNTAHHAFGKYWMQARGLLNYYFKYCWLKVICCFCEPNELEREIKKKLEGQAKTWGAWPTQAPLSIATESLVSNPLTYGLFFIYFVVRIFWWNQLAINSLLVSVSRWNSWLEPC